VCSTRKLDLVRSLGANRVIDYTREDFAAGGQRYDLILDIGGNSSLSRLRRALAPKGTLVITGGEEGGRWTGGIDLIECARCARWARQRRIAEVVPSLEDRAPDVLRS
jgi:NADPH:quinone reductase-like Zn-dependent oxidoreductase